MRQSRSIRTRLLLALMLMTLLTLIIASGVSAVMDLKMFRDHMMRDLRVLAAVVGENCVSALVFDSRDSAQEKLATLSGEYQIRSATLYSSDDLVFARWHPSERVHAGRLAPMVEIMHPLSFDGRPIGRLVVEARLVELSRQARHYMLLAVGLVLLTLVIALVVALRLQRRIAGPLLDLVDATRSVSARGDYRAHVRAPNADREIATLVSSFNEMLAQIEQREHALDAANAQLRRLATHLSLLEESEKARLAGELHDGPMQKLALAQMQIDAGAQTSHEADADEQEAHQQLQVGLALMREAIGELRTLQFDLSPPVLHKRGLAAALDWLAGNTEERWGVDMRCEIDSGLPALTERQSIFLFQCARELVYNLIKHARAQVGEITLTADAEGVELAVADDGQGFDWRRQPEPRPDATGGYGLYSIRQRLALFGGSLEIESDGAGSRLTIRVPLE